MSQDNRIADLKSMPGSPGNGNEKNTAVIEKLIGIMKNIFPIAPSKEDLHVPFLELGANSLNFIELIRFIEGVYGIRLAVPQFFRKLRTIHELASYLEQSLPAGPEDSSRVGASTAENRLLEQTHSPADRTEEARSESPRRNPDAPGDHVEIPRPAGVVAAGAEAARELEAIFTRQLQLSSQAVSEVIAQQLAFLKNNGFAAKSAQSPVVPAPRTFARPAEPAGKIEKPAPASLTRAAGKPVLPLVAGRLDPERLATESSAAKKEYIEALIKRFTARTKTSKALIGQFRPVLADSRATVDFRMSIKEMLYPIVGKHSQDARIRDVDDNEYIDITMGFGILLFGHNPAFVMKAIREEMDHNLQLGPRAQQAGELASLISELTGQERVVFSNTGTEAVMAALRLARAATGRNKIVLFEGSYHGHADQTLAMAAPGADRDHPVSVAVTPGTPPNVVKDIMVLKFGEEQALETIKKHGSEIAAVLIEPVQSRRPELQPKVFHHELRALTQETGSLLIFDEMITGFRVHPGGAQAWFGIQADLATYGKLIGGGFPIGVVAGKAQYMDAIDGGMWQYGDSSYPEAERIYFGGTFCQHPVAMAAGLAVLKHLKEQGPALQERLNGQTAQLAGTLNSFFEQEDLPIRMVHFGSLFRLASPANIELLFYRLLEEGLFVWEWRNYFLSTAHSDQDVHSIAEKIQECAKDLQVNGFLPGGERKFPRKIVSPAQPAAPSAVADRAEPDDSFPLTENQKQLWIFSQVHEAGSLVYNDSLSLKFKGPLNPDTLSRALQTIVDRYEILRATISSDGQYHKILSMIKTELPLIDFSACRPQERALRIEHWVKEENEREFDFQKGPLFRAALLKLEKDVHLFILIINHIIFDGLSCIVLLNELSAIYSAACQKIPPRLAAPLLFRDYVQKSLAQIRSGETERQSAYWTAKFSDTVPDLNLPVYHPTRDVMKSYRAQTEKIEVAPALYQALKTMGRAHGCTPFMVLLSVYMVFLHRLTNQTMILVGIPVSGRPPETNEKLVGFCAYFLPILGSMRGNQSFSASLVSIRDVLLEAYEHQDYPFAALRNPPSAGRDLNQEPFLHAIFNLDQIKIPEFHGLQSELYFLPHHFAPFEFNLMGTETDQGLTLMFGLNADLFDASASARITGYFKTLLNAVAERPERLVSDLPLQGDDERRRLLQEWNTAAATADIALKRVHELFEQQVARTPEATAVKFNDRGLSYAELNSRANQLAHLLRDKGVNSKSIVGVMLERSPDMLAGILGVLKAGGAYMPLDPSYPEERIYAMLKDSNSSLLISREKVVNRYSFTELSNVKFNQVRPVLTAARAFVTDFDQLPIPDRTLIDYKKYHQFQGISMGRHYVALQLSRGCPYNCFYCHKIWPKTQVRRSEENIYEEIRHCHAAGLRRFVIVDDIFNLDKKSSSSLLRRIIKDKLGIQLFFPNGLRGDILTQEFIDLLVEAGTVDVALALETASPRLQKMIRKNLDLDKFRKNFEYITKVHPQMITEMHMMLGFPTETEEEAMQTYRFLQNLHWIHFPNLFILKIFPNTDVARWAMAHGISEKLIEISAKRAYHELPETLPYPKHFVREFQSRFMSDYFMSKERLLKVLPQQLKILTIEEMVLKYDSYLPINIQKFSDILNAFGISEEELGAVKPLPADNRAAPDFVENMRKYFPVQKKSPDAFRILLLDLSTLFKKDAEGNLHDVVEAPLGLLYLLTYLNEKFGPRILGKIAKSRMDFNDYDGLRKIIAEFRPQLIGIRSLSITKEFFHKTVALIRQWIPDVPIITGGPYATSEYDAILSDPNIDVAVLSEGELTLHEFVQAVLANHGSLPSSDVLEQIPGLAFIPRSFRNRNESAGQHREIILLDRLEDELVKYKTADPIPVSQPDDPAYVLYTSGSTGLPKGVIMEHRPLLNLIAWQTGDPAFKHPVKALQFAPLNFDVSFQEIFSTFAAGGTLILVAEEDRRDPVVLLELIKREKIERLFMPFVALQQLAEAVEMDNDLLPGTLRDIITAGDRLQITPEISALFRKLHQCRLHNQYGPTESHVVTYFILNAPVEPWPPFPPIGRPIANAKIYILDPLLKPVPIGTPGEIHIGGVSLARAYLNQAEMTREKFIADPFADDPGARLYKTGDFGRFYADGNIGFIGRMDQQVKVRGYRIELGEIEATLRQHPYVKEAVVLGKEEHLGNKRLAAYCMPQAGAVPSGDELRQFLKERMPEYMVPSDFIILESLPLTASGKIDRRVLVSMKEDHEGENYVAPRTEVEKKLHDIWSEILEVKRIGIHDNFFELGGHSLLATQVINRIHKNMSLKLSMKSLSDRPTIAGLAERIEALRGAAADALPASEALPAEREEMVF